MKSRARRGNLEKPLYRQTNNNPVTMTTITKYNT